MKTNPLDQLKGICEQLLFRVANLQKSFKHFFIETMICYLSITGCVNFSQMTRFGKSCESRFRQNFKRKFDWVAFNTGLASRTEGHLRAIALDPCYIPKSGKKTPGLGYFWSGTANATKRGLEVLGMALVDATERLAIFLTAVQTLNDEVLATAIIDRLLYRFEVIKLAGTSYRLENRKTIFHNEPTTQESNKK